jgi:hypothetical protein
MRYSARPIEIVTVVFGRSKPLSKSETDDNEGQLFASLIVISCHCHWNGGSRFVFLWHLCNIAKHLGSSRFDDNET